MTAELARPPCPARFRVACSRAVRKLILVIALSSTSIALGCRDKPSATETAKDASLPVVTDATTDAVLTWIDEKGEFHREQRVADVPSASRDAVRVIDPMHEDPPEKIFVADLRSAGPDGKYAVRALSRDDFENVAVERRKRGGAVLAARPPSSVAPEAPAAPSAGSTAPSGTTAIIYGAEWCGPCHQAEAYLQQKGVPHVKKDIEKDPSAAREMQAKLARVGRGGGSIPVLDVRGKILVGFDPRAVDRALAQPL